MNRLSRVVLPCSVVLGIILLMSAFGCQRSAGGTDSIITPLRFAISFPADLEATPLDGRMLLMISNNDTAEPRFQINDSVQTQLIFGIDVDGLKPGDEAVIDGTVLGYPLDSIGQIPAGAYRVQALLHRYETFHRADGHVVKLPMDRGEGQKWNRAPGNLYSTPKEVAIDPAKAEVIRVSLDNVIPPIPDPPETKYVKHVRIQSELLTKFWGRPMHLGAHVLLPHGYDEHPMHVTRSSSTTVISRTTSEGSGKNRRIPTSSPTSASASTGRATTGRSRSMRTSSTRTGRVPSFPRVLIVEIQHANPYYDDSYGVNSANLGPYGDAITYELIPHIEKEFRGLGQGWARFMYGGSTGGWIPLAVQIMYPDEYNGCYAACPDPIDFRAYTVVDIYKDKNAYFLDSPWKKTPRPGAGLPRPCEDSPG
jgi:hypothetical protein